MLFDSAENISCCGAIMHSLKISTQGFSPCYLKLSFQSTGYDMKMDSLKQLPALQRIGIAVIDGSMVRLHRSCLCNGFPLQPRGSDELHSFPAVNLFTEFAACQFHSS